jgi:hypothetical protein
VVYITIKNSLQSRGPASSARRLDYQRPEKPSDQVVGVVREGRQIPFHDMEELRTILVKNDLDGKRAKPRAKPSRKR